MERYKRLKGRRTGLKSSCTRQIKKLSEFLNHETPFETAFEEKRLILKRTLTDLRAVSDDISNILLDLPEDNYDDALKDHDENVIELESRESDAAQIKVEFDRLLETSKPKPKPPPTVQNDLAKPEVKFSPKDLHVPLWDGDIVTLNAWQKRLDNYFKLTGDQQLTILLYENVLPPKLQSTLQDCTSTDEVWERLKLKFPYESIPQVILLKLKELKPMKSASADELRRILENIKDYARHAKESDCAKDLECYATIDLIEQKLTDSVTRNFRKWVHRQYGSKELNVDMLIKFLQFETELEERITTKFPSQLSFRAKSKPTTVNHMRSNYPNNNCCSLCGKDRHKFVECENFIKYNPQERSDAMKRLGRCFTCLAAMHKTPKDCKYRRRCPSCQKSHHTLLACVRPNFPKPTYAGTTNTPLSTSSPAFQPDVPIVRSMSKFSNSTTKYAPATYVEVLGYDGVWRKVVAMFDSGSDVTLVRRDVVSSLKLERRPQPIKFGTAGGGFWTEDSALVSLWVRRPDITSRRFHLKAIELQKPAHEISCLNENFFEQYPYLKPVENCVPRDSTNVDLLIGFDCAALISPISYLHHPASMDMFPRAAETLLGWYIYGPFQQSVGFDDRVCIQHVQTDNLDIRKWYEADICGVKPTSICVCDEKEIKESQFLKHVRKTIKQTEDGRVEVSLPWKEGFPECFSFNRKQALAKLVSLERRLGNLNMMTQYDQQMQIIIDEFAEPVPNEEVIERSGRYLDHFFVLKPGKSTACRVVWNSATIYDGLALNDGLHKGPDLLNNLFTVLLAWRQNKIAIVGDIRKMFNQILISPPDRIYHRFLWRREKSQPPRDYQWKRLPFGDKSAPDLAISALRFLADKFKIACPCASSIIRDHCYMDDLASSLCSETEASYVKQEINSVLSSGKFEVKGWHSNSEIVDELQEELEVDVLGHQWNKLDDTLKTKMPVFTVPDVVTKRVILSCIAKLWDPIGILAPVTVKLRLILQNLWATEMSWDDQVSEETALQLSIQLRELEMLRQLNIPRCIKTIECDSPELHGFCDASEKAYGAVIWLRLQKNSKDFDLNFVAAKSFVAPKKKKSIPRLELMATLVLSRLINSVNKILDVNRVFIWTDSAVVLYWLKLPVTNFKPFVSTRVQEITENLSKFTFSCRYVKSSLNPADALTKPSMNYSELSSWHHGPEFLKGCENDWPRELIPAPDIKQTSREMKKLEPVKLHHAAYTMNFGEILLKRVSTWSKLVRIVAWLRRPMFKSTAKPETLSAQELTTAKLTLFWISQVSLRCPEQRCLRERLNLNFDDNERALLRVYGRLSNLHERSDVANPIALPGNNQIVRLYVTDIHEKLGHQGYRVAIVNLRESGIYVTRARQLLKSIASKCLHCRKMRRHLLQQQMGQLPSFRFRVNQPPFSSVALDYFGFIKIKKTRNVVKDASVLLITCTTTRVVHLEICETQTTDDFILAWRRFTAKRHIHPLHVFSDMGKSFVGAQKPLREWISNWNKTKLVDFLASHGTEFKFNWEFNIPRASHMNGVVESLVRSCRKALTSACNYHKFSYTNSEWETIIAEVNYLVNSRPLFPKTVQNLDEEPITGNSLLYPHGQPMIPQTELSLPSFVDPRASINRAQKFIKLFWEAWMRNMPPHLLFRNKWFRPRDNLKEGDYVIVLEPGMKGQCAPRSLWEHAIVIKLMPGCDRLVRKVELRLSGQRKLMRPIHKLCLIATAEELKSGLQ